MPCGQAFVAQKAGVGVGLVKGRGHAFQLGITDAGAAGRQGRDAGGDPVAPGAVHRRAPALQAVVRVVRKFARVWCEELSRTLSCLSFAMGFYRR